MKKFGRSLQHQDEAIQSVVAEVNCTRVSKMTIEEIAFGDKDCMGTDYPHTDALVISADIGLAKVHRILVDEGSSVSLLFKMTFDQMGLSKKDLMPCT